MRFIFRATEIAVANYATAFWSRSFGTAFAGRRELIRKWPLTMRGSRVLIT